MSHCVHFGVCGGCAFDDRAPTDKRAAVAAALTRAGFDAAMLGALVKIPLHTRRRVDLGATRSGTEIVLGLHKAGNAAEIVDMQECVLVRPAILALLPPLRVLLRSLESFRKTAAIHITMLDSGADILIAGDAPVTSPDRTRMIAFAKAHGVCRIAVADGEPVAILQPPVIIFGKVPVELPPAAFLQASAAGEAAILAALRAALPQKLKPKSHIVELFAGCGTFSFPLAAVARVDAYEGDAAAATAADRAARAANARVTMHQRDLHRRPLQPAEFAGAACVVLDPPFSGAGAQMRFLAASNVPSLIYISCNPTALAADAAQLHRAGYSLAAATAIDQFPFSENVEAVCSFVKIKRRL